MLARNGGSAVSAASVPTGQSTQGVLFLRRFHASFRKNLPLCRRINVTENFGLGSRDTGTAGQYTLNNNARDGAETALHTATTNGDRWESFAAWAKDGERKWKTLLQSW